MEEKKKQNCLAGSCLAIVMKNDFVTEEFCSCLLVIENNLNQAGITSYPYRFSALKALLFFSTSVRLLQGIAFLMLETMKCDCRQHERDQQTSEEKKSNTVLVSHHSQIFSAENLRAFKNVYFNRYRPP